jgi:hypothetical protein
MIVKEFGPQEYGYVVRGMTTYSIPFLYQNTVPDIVHGNRCPVECVSKGGSESETAKGFCEKNWVLCVIGAFAIGVLLFGD